MKSIKLPWGRNDRTQDGGRDREQRPAGGSSDAYAVALVQCESHAERKLEHLHPGAVDLVPRHRALSAARDEVTRA